jgi:hypothetical protein
VALTFAMPHASALHALVHHRHAGMALGVALLRAFSGGLHALTAACGIAGTLEIGEGQWGRRKQGYDDDVAYRFHMLSWM